MFSCSSCFARNSGNVVGDFVGFMLLEETKSSPGEHGCYQKHEEKLQYFIITVVEIIVVNIYNLLVICEFVQNQESVTKYHPNP